MSRINTNIAALQGIRNLSKNQDDLNVRLERLSTGLRINHGADDPSGLIASEVLRSEIRTIQQAVENSGRAANVILTAEGALNEVSSLLLDLQDLIVETSNSGGLTNAEVNANQVQIDSILGSIDRIAQTTEFGSKKLLDGSQAYIASGVPATALNLVSLFSVLVPQGGARTVTVRVTQSAQTARVAIVGATIGGASTTSAVTVEIKGNFGTEVFTFASGSTFGNIRAAVNNLTAALGVSAVVSTTTAGPVRSALVLNSTAFGSDAFVSVSPISGNLALSVPQGGVRRDTGVDAGVLVDGQLASSSGLRAEVRSQGLDVRLELGRAFAQQTLSTASFSVTGGGALFQLTPEISPNGQVTVGLNSVATSQLGNNVTGLLYTLRSGQRNDLSTGRMDVAQRIVDEAVSQISTYRGRLGSLHKNQIQPNINSQNVTLENVTASESVIRDADMAVEVSALTRAQILVQSTQSTLQVANSLPRQILALLQ